MLSPATETVDARKTAADRLLQQGIQGIALSNIGFVLQQQQPELAIVFYKQSVNVRETIRQDICPLARSRSLQKSYTQTVAGTIVGQSRRRLC